MSGARSDRKLEKESRHEDQASRHRLGRRPRGRLHHRLLDDHDGPARRRPVAKRHSIDANVDSALARLYAQDPSSRELVGKARGVLVFPSIVSAGFVVGGSYGQGALRVHGRTTEYYSTAAGSVGLLAGAESKSVYLLFMTDEALDKFRASKGWTVGADASVTLVNVGANAQVDTQDRASRRSSATSSPTAA